MILVTGAGGKTGRSLIRALSRFESVCALVRRRKQVALVKGMGADKLIVGDMRDESVIRSAMQGVRGVYYICPNMSPDEVVIGRLVIDAARGSSVEHFVYHSVLHPQTEKMGHHWQKLRVEEMILESGLPFTILQPAPYMQNWSAGWQTILEEGLLRVPYSVASKFSFVDLEDIAAAAAIVLTGTRHLNATYELAGTEPRSHAEVAEILSIVLSRDICAEKETIGHWRMRSKGLSDFAVENLVKMFAYYDQWGLVGNPNVLSWLLKREPRSLESFIQNTASQLAAGRQNQSDYRG